MRKLRVLVVDDSAYNRRTISALLSSIPEVEVVDKAADGDEALRLATALKPDLITLDLEMPRVDGFTFLRLLMARQPTPVIVISGYSHKENVFRALELGALDFVPKPTRVVSSDLSGIREELIDKITLVRHLTAPRSAPRRSPTELAARSLRSTPEEDETARVRVGAPKRLLAVAASTGGPTALLELFARLPAEATVVVAQHMPERFTKTFAERLDRLGRLRVHEAKNRHSLHAGVAYICPGGQCMEVVLDDGQFYVEVRKASEKDRYVPSADRLLTSAAKAAGKRVVAAVLTGMGDDGAKGVAAVKEAGGVVLAESKETAVIYGMPAAAVRTGSVDMTLPLMSLSNKLAALSTQSL